MANAPSESAIRAGLSTQVFGQSVRHYAQIGSTNTQLKRLADRGAAEGLLVVADEQLAGRGRFERTWHAPPGSSLLMSLLFRPTFLAPTQAQYLTMICALAAVEAIAEQTGLSVDLKWPNDLVYEENKLGGVLTELGFAGEALDWVVVGMGLNVNVDFNAFTPSVLPNDVPWIESATSLQMILGRPVSRLALLQTYLIEVENRYDALRAGQSPHRAWAEKLVTLGRQVTVSDLDTTYHGLAEAVAEDGALLVRQPDGPLQRVLTGDVTLGRF